MPRQLPIAAFAIGESIQRNVTSRAHSWPRALSTTTPCLATKAFPPRRIIPDSEIEESFLKGSGPGGQKINKTNSAVQLKHLPTGIVIKCQDQRSRDYNRKEARKILADKLEELELGENSRVRLKEKEAARKKASKNKKARRKYRALEQEKAGGDPKAEGINAEAHGDIEAGTAAKADASAATDSVVIKDGRER